MMRWFVEISSFGQATQPGKKVCVEAPQWHLALQKARALQGEEAQLTNFSVELLDNGYKAIDPSARQLYVIREAPPTEPLTEIEANPKNGATPQNVNNETSRDHGKAVSKGIARVETVPFVSEGSAIIKEKPDASPSAAIRAPEADRSSDGKSVQEKSSSSADPPKPKLPSFALLSTREQNPSEQSPLTYRECVYAVSASTSEEAARALLLDRLEEVRYSIEDARAGKLINLAIFDHFFEGRPSKRPIATLTWKDWKGSEPEIRYPHRPPEKAPPEPAKPTIVQSEGATAKVIIQTPKPTKGAVDIPKVIVTDAPKVAPKAVADAPKVAPAKVVADTPKVATAKVVADAPKTPPKSNAQPQKPIPGVVVSPEDAPPLPAVSSGAKPADASKVAPQAPAAAQIPKAVAKTPAKADVGKTPAGAPKPAPQRKAGARLSGDDLIAVLFEACCDLHFHDNVLEGAEFLLTLTMDKIPSTMGMISLFDINKREFVVVRQAGGSNVLLSRLPERSPIAQRAMRSRRAVVIKDVSRDSTVMDERWRASGLQLRSIICAPVELSGRYLGLIELANPADGGLFTDTEGNALTYIGEQFAEFVAAHGVVLDPDLVLAGAKSSAPQGAH